MVTLLLNLGIAQNPRSPPRGSVQEGGDKDLCRTTESIKAFFKKNCTYTDDHGLVPKKHVTKTFNATHYFAVLLFNIPRKSVGLTWENKPVHTEFVTTFRNFDFSVGRMSTYELKK